MAHSIYYYDKTERRYEGRKRICSQCSKEEIVRSSNKCTRCNECSRNRPKDAIEYCDSNGKKYPGRKKICKECGKESLVRYSNKTKYCNRCICKKREISIKEGELFIKKPNGQRTRAKILKCSCCGKKRLARSSYNYKTNLCRDCNAVEQGKIHGTTNGLMSRIHGMSCYRRDGFKAHGKKCECCKSVLNILIHHIDLNRYNNDPANLLPLCYSCHALIHWKIRKGFHYYGAIELVKKYIPNVKLLYI